MQSNPPVAGRIQHGVIGPRAAICLGIDPGSKCTYYQHALDVEIAVSIFVNDIFVGNYVPIGNGFIQPFTH